MLVTIHWKVLVHREALVMAGLMRNRHHTPTKPVSFFRNAILVAQLPQAASGTPSQGQMASSDGGRSAATRHCDMAR